MQNYILYTFLETETAMNFKNNETYLWSAK